MSLALSGYINKDTNRKFDADIAPIFGQVFDAKVIPGIVCSTSICDGKLIVHREFRLKTVVGGPLFVTASRPAESMRRTDTDGLDFFSGVAVTYLVSYRIAGRRHVLNETHTLTGAVESVARAQRGVFRTSAAPKAV